VWRPTLTAIFALVDGDLQVRDAAAEVAVEPFAEHAGAVASRP
jgi:hypothetical protein